jgi:hypothetical protein
LSRKITIKLLLILFVASILILPTATGAPTTSRTMPTLVNVGAPFTVSISVSDYGSFGQVVETIPSGFIYVESSLGVTQTEDAGNTLKFTLMGESSFYYTLIAPNHENSYTFCGIIIDGDSNEFTIGGDTSIMVGETTEPTNDPSPDEQTTNGESDLVKPETISENPDEAVESEISENPDEAVESEDPMDDTNTESSMSVKTDTSTESTEDIPESEATPFITSFGVIVIGIIASLVYKLKKY